MTATDLIAKARTFAARGEIDAALAAFDKALAQTPNDPDALNAKGALLGRLGRHADALLMFDALVRLFPDNATAHYNRGRALAALDRFEEASAAYETALRLDADLAGVSNNLGAAYEALGRRGDAMAAYERAASRGEPNGAYNKALMLLAQGDWDEGFRLYEHRFAAGQSKRDAHADDAPQWDGGRVDGPLRIWCEQGVGDQILFSRLLPLVFERTQDVVVEVDARLVWMLGCAYPETYVCDRAEPVRGVKSQIGLGSLPHILRAQSQQLEAHALAPRSESPGSLRANRSAPENRALSLDIARSAALRRKYVTPTGARKLIGVAWASPLAPHARQKGAPLEAFAPLFRDARSDVAFVSLQYGEQARGDIARTGAPLIVDETIDQMRDFDGFAAQLAALDAIVTVSNTLVHVAGAMGLPAHVLVPPARGRHWYWGLEGERTPWYPSLHLVRRALDESWETQVARAADAVKKQLGL